MANQLTLINTSINSGTAVRLLNGEFTYSWQNQIDAPIIATGYGNSESQFSGWENPIINLTFLIPVDSIPAGTMTWALWNQFVKNQYLGTSATQTKLSAVVGAGDTQFISYAASSSSTGTSTVPIVVKGYTLTFDPGDSVNASLWRINAQLQETK